MRQVDLHLKPVKPAPVKEPEPNVYTMMLYSCYVDISEDDPDSFDYKTEDVLINTVDETRTWHCEYAEFKDGYCIVGCDGPGICVDVKNPPKRASFRIRRRYYDLIVKGEKTEEIRTHSPHWRKQLLSGNPPQIAVFVCGKDVHRRWITGITLNDAEKVLGRPLSEQGKQDVLTPEEAIIIKLGDEY